MPSTRPASKTLIRQSRHNAALEQACTQILDRVVHLLPGVDHRICAIASTAVGDGRTSLALNLAEVASRAPRSSVLVIDADNSAPGVHDALGLDRAPGLSDVLSGATALEAALRPIEGDGRLQVLTAGTTNIDGASLGNAKAIQPFFSALRERFHWVFVDTAPMLTSPAGLGMARLADGVIYAVRHGRTRGLIAEQGLALLNEAGARTLGVVLTQRRFVIPSYIYNRL